MERPAPDSQSAVAVAETGGEVRSLGVIPNAPGSVSKLIKKLGKPQQLRVCYEAGSTGYALYWQLSALDVKCEWWPRRWCR